MQVQPTTTVWKEAVKQRPSSGRFRTRMFWWTGTEFRSRYGPEHEALVHSASQRVEGIRFFTVDDLNKRQLGQSCGTWDVMSNVGFCSSGFRNRRKTTS